MRRITATLAILLLFLAAGIAPKSALAQAALATIQGTLSDRTGAAIAGAKITATSAGSGLSWSAITDWNGRYSLASLPPGAFEIHVRQEGFAEQLRTVALTPGAVVNLPLMLSVAAVVQQVNVSAGPVNDGIEAREIRESSARDLGEVTENIAGVQKVRQAGIANDIAIRGLYHDNLASTFDGARIYGACTGQMDPAAFHVDLAEVSHVDIVKGPFDVTTQGALGGQVKVITKTPSAHGVDLASNVSTGSYGYYNPSQTAQVGGDTFHLLAGYSYRTSEMYRDGNGKLVSRLANYRNNADHLQAFRVQSGWTRLAFEPVPSQRAELGYSRQQGGIVLYPYKTMDGIFDDVDRFSFRYDYLKSHRVLNAAHVVVYADKVNHLMDNRLRASAGAMQVSMSTQVVSFTDGLRTDADLTGGFNAGFETYRRYWNSAGFMVMNAMGKTTITNTNTLPGVTEWVNGGYIAYRSTFGRTFLLTAGGRYDHSRSDASKASPALYLAYHGASITATSDSGVSGNVKITWQGSPFASVFAGVGSNIRFPDPEERFFHSDSAMGTGWVGNPRLAHPRNTEFDLGLTARNSRITVSPLFFFSDLGDYITLYAADRLQTVAGVMSKKAQSYANVTAHQWGSELTATAQAPAGIQIFGTLAYARGTKVPRPNENMRSSNLFQVPPLKASINVRYERRRFSSEFSGVVTGRQDHVDTDVNEKRTAGSSIFNLKGGYRARGFGFEGGVNNLFSRQYSEFLSYVRNPYTNGVRMPEPGRNYFCNLTYTFTGGPR